MTDNAESQTDEQAVLDLLVAARQADLIDGPWDHLRVLSRRVAVLVRKSRAEGVDSQEETIQRLRGSLQNCVNHLNRKRRYGERGYDQCIDQANRVLYETLNGATNDTD